MTINEFGNVNINNNTTLLSSLNVSGTTTLSNNVTIKGELVNQSPSKRTVNDGTKEDWIIIFSFLFKL